MPASCCAQALQMHCLPFFAAGTLFNSCSEKLTDPAWHQQEPALPPENAAAHAFAAPHKGHFPGSIETVSCTSMSVCRNDFRLPRNVRVHGNPIKQGLHSCAANATSKARHTARQLTSARFRRQPSSPEPSLARTPDAPRLPRSPPGPVDAL